MVKEFIKNHINPNTFNDYKLNNGVWTLAEWQSNALGNNPFDIGDSLYFFYYFQMIGIIDNVNDLSKGIAIIVNDRTNTQRVDYKNRVKYTSIDGAYIASSDFISLHEKSVKITIPSANVFSEIIQGHIAYYSLTKL